MEHIKHVMHGESKTRLYRIWSNLKNRVLPNSVKSKYYFDRGIGLCDEWKNSFISFRDWSINNGYDDKLTLDRIDNDGSYTPENCRWVDMKVQSNNRSNNISVRIEEGCIPFSEICRVLNIDYMYAYNKVVKHLSQEIDVERIGKNWKEEPVSEELEEVSHRYMFYEHTSPLNEVMHQADLNAEKQYHEDIKNAFKAGAQWQKQQFEKNRLEHCDSITEEQYNLEVGFIDSHIDKYNRMPTFLDAIEYGMEKMKEEMMAKAIDANCFGFQGAALFSFRLPADNYLVGSKVKVIVIKED